MPETSVHRRRFTAIELAVVIILVGILAVTAVVKTGGLVQHSTLVGQAQQLKAHLRHVQALSMRQDTHTYGIHFTSDSYTLYEDGSASARTFPFEDHTIIDLSAGLALTQGAGITVTFDDWGSPGASNIDLTLSNGSDSRTITVTRETGFIP